MLCLSNLQLANELRWYTLESVSQTGGHLSSSLGVNELTVALHYVFDMPEDDMGDGDIADERNNGFGHECNCDENETCIFKTLRQKVPLIEKVYFKSYRKM